MCVPKRREEKVLATGQVSPVEEVGSLKEGFWLEPVLLLLRKKTKEEWTEKHRNVARKSVLEGGCRKDSSTFVGQMKVSAKHVRRRKAQKSAALPLPVMVRDQTVEPRGFQKVGAKNENLKEGVEMAKRYCNAFTQWKSMEQGPFQKNKGGSLRSTRVGGMPAEGFKGHDATDGSLAGAPLEGGEHVVGQCCNWITMKNWGLYMGCTARRRQTLKRTIKRAGEWTFERTREAHEKVAMDDFGRLGIAQEILRKSTDFLRRIIAPVDGMGGVTFVVCWPALHPFPVGSHLGIDRTTETATTKLEALQLVVCGLWRPIRMESA